MQFTKFNLSPQNLNTPSPDLDLFAQGVRIRLEQFVFNAQNLLDHYQQNNLDTLADAYELALLELRILNNDLKLLVALNEKRVSPHYN